MAQAQSETAKQKKFVIGSRPPELSPEAQLKLHKMRPNKKALERVANMVKLKVVDGATCGF